jgi:hypothetical protein
MKTTFLSIGLLVLLFITLKLIQLSRQGQTITMGNRIQHRYIARDIMTAAERRAYKSLADLLPNCRIYPQVAMAAIIGPNPSHDFTERQRTRGTFSQKYIDFVIENPRDGKVLALIELDDHTHDAAKDAARDAMTAEAGYITIRLSDSKQTTIAAALSQALPDLSLTLPRVMQ